MSALARAVVLPGRRAEARSGDVHRIGSPTYVHPGQTVVSGGPAVLTTILGSCVTVCLHDRKRAIGGMNHYLLPTLGAEIGQPGRYGPTAMDELVSLMLAWGASTEHMEAQIYGGASVLNAFAAADHLGLRNVVVARKALAEHRIRVIAADVGGQRGRKIVFDPATGEAKVQVIGK